ncbi:GNAT family N-acetyltransferase [Bacillus mesophilus]|uniref:GNAT family N-acetyltransferase n=1 Tax=Bacillus mesophilus TaxID=1808955 RepID=A0A6M0QB53_9BACI|nr:GNAT family N-acetyltransferase [Bacillus mesophilus]
MSIRKLEIEENPPLSLLLLADPSREMVEDYTRRGVTYIAEILGNVIGVYVIVPLEHDTIELKNVAIDERLQGQGLGKLLVHHSIEEARGLGYQKIEVGTGNSSISQLALYQKCGFRIDSIEKDFFIKHYKEVIVENGIQCRDMVRLSQCLT